MGKVKCRKLLPAWLVPIVPWWPCLRNGQRTGETGLGCIRVAGRHIHFCSSACWVTFVKQKELPQFLGALICFKDHILEFLALYKGIGKAQASAGGIACDGAAQHQHSSGEFFYEH